jgi:hypothetical protein
MTDHGRAEPRADAAGIHRLVTDPQLPATNVCNRGFHFDVLHHKWCSQSNRLPRSRRAFDTLSWCLFATVRSPE